MKDDGTPDYEIKNAFRFKDQPNVLYAIYTGSIRRHGDANTIESKLPVARYGLEPIRLVMPLEPENYRRITDFKQTVPFGNQQMEITGVIFTEKQPEDPQHPEYVYFLGGQIRNTYKNTEAADKPYIGFQISAFPRDEKKGLITKAPSPEEAIQRVIPLLKSMHLGLQAYRKDEI